MLKKLKSLRNLFFKSDDGHAISRQEKMAFSTPVGLSWDSPPSPKESVRTDGRTEVRTDGHVTITSKPKFLGLIGYQIFLAMELRWRALPAGSAIKPCLFLCSLQIYRNQIKKKWNVKFVKYIKRKVTGYN